ncbi:hypothetical protein KFE25_007921 [Diacronema lutheri]|uniref:Protein kinase domain-containing protein n=1 Tax=Diacronema lutheri TaxID=2081491 RepID=A0A8J5XM26_DIALT|nr:hypothetical protein KFE25_007921 [Diacronema lutheri]
MRAAGGRGRKVGLHRAYGLPRGTPHEASYGKLHREPLAPKTAAAAGGAGFASRDDAPALGDTGAPCEPRAAAHAPLRHIVARAPETCHPRASTAALALARPRAIAACAAPAAAAGQRGAGCSLGGSSADAPTGLDLQALIDEGAHAKVYRARYGTLGECAAKVLSKRTMSAAEQAWVRAEVAVHRRLLHPHIVALHTAFETPRDITLVLALCRGGSLRELMDETVQSGRSLPEALCRHYFRQLVGALHYCHRHGVVHRDIKLDNLAFADGARETLMLLDFGFAAQTNRLRGFVGSPHFAAPEVHAARRVAARAGAGAGTGDAARARQPRVPAAATAAAGGTYAGTPTDVWSAGVVLFALLSNSLPFCGDEGSEDLSRAIITGTWGARPRCDDAGLDLLNALLRVDPLKRASLDDVCEHPWTLHGGRDAGRDVPAAQPSVSGARRDDASARASPGEPPCLVMESGAQAASAAHGAAAALVQPVPCASAPEVASCAPPAADLLPAVAPSTADQAPASSPNSASERPLSPPGSPGLVSAPARAGSRTHGVSVSLCNDLIPWRGFNDVVD